MTPRIRRTSRGADGPRAHDRRTGARQHRGAALTALLTLVALLVSVGAAVTWTSPASAEDDFALEVDHGHVDAFTLLWSDSQLQVRLQEDVTGHHVLHDADQVLLKVKDAARITLPTPVPENLSFLGSPGKDVWFLPQTQDPDLIWPGWSTERIPSGVFEDPMQIHVDAVDGPGEVFLWQTGSFGDSAPVLDSGGYQLPGRISSNINAHVHANWAFTAPGRYVFTVRASGWGTTGETVESAPVTYTFDVGDATTPPTTTLPTTTPPTTTPPTTTPPTTTPPTTTPPTSTPPPGSAGTWDVPNGTVNSQGATVLNSGHVDVASLLESTQLTTRIKDTTTSTPVWRDPARTVLQLLPRSRATVPANPAYSFLGGAGETFYQVTQTQQPGLLWPGWSTESIPVDATTGGVIWSLDDMSGPGQFAIYETDPFGRPSVLFNTRDGITGADRFTISKNTHAHGSWAFSQQGLYCLSGQRAAQLTSGETVSDRFVLAVAVGTSDVMGVDPARCGDEVVTDAPAVAPPSADEAPTGGAKGGKGEDDGKGGTGSKGGKGGKPRDGDDQDESGHTDGAVTGNSSDAGSGTGANTCVPSILPTPRSIRTTPRALTAPSAPSAPRAPAENITVLSAGHIDYAARIVGGRLASQIGDDTSGSKVYREPSSTVLWLKPASKVTLPSGYGSVGGAGARVWQVPQTQNPSLIWLGWSTEELNAGNTRGEVTWRLDRALGPGTVKVYLSGSFGGVQEMVFSGAGSSYQIPLGVHTHANWAFSKEGMYRLTFTQGVTLADGTRTSDTETVTVAVGDVDPASASAATPGATPPASVDSPDITSETDCASIAGSTSSPSEVEVAPAAAPQVSAPAAAPGGLTTDPVAGIAVPEESVQVASPREESEPVPLLLGALGALLLIGASGTGVLWWRGPAPSAGGAA